VIASLKQLVGLYVLVSGVVNAVCGFALLTDDNNIPTHSALIIAVLAGVCWPIVVGVLILARRDTLEEYSKP
jgi:uncharacterized membrane protein HdeD (DUF308 family)